ncbi:membrane protein insertion efficiency factor YidD [Akkermansia sp. N21169]|jgi:putative membrane protein insertion efficiency factor|uniref:membrane protein insertion efficiency factor YidD n=1 Tax=unclassified Akkermansia TaxID=2608915 RepID=UPI00244EFEC5|nr:MULTISPECIES: membrane protein insertion efficiency factor YidD [unclassified Akkermansia]MDH3067679.1 membrane protein insertion efficiency factor YidD [Akkermansia sp. N21169]WPX41625.1 membrane protein insertion efficiency factor YidD [Akkermansia sp. N21116]
MKKLVIACVRFYQRFVSRPLHFLGGPMSGCRFSPTCSQYFIEAVEIHGIWKGTTLGIWRILRCNPWGGSGFDPVPPRCSSGSSHFPGDGDASK